MTRLETRYPCPVCLAVKMEKVRLSTIAGPKKPSARRSTELVIDHCPRCGGVWFDAGEVQLLRGVDAESLWRAIVKREGVHSMACHSCRTLLPRTESSCPACGWKVALDCPICAQPMRTSEQHGMRLDYCPRDKGVWFDHDELTGIWTLEAGALVRRRGSRELEVGDDVVLLDALLLDPFVMYYGLSAAAHVGGGAVEALASSGAVGAAGEAAGAVGEVASSIFETIADIIGGIFG